MTGRLVALATASAMGLTACGTGALWSAGRAPEQSECLSMDLDGETRASPHGIFHVPIGPALHGGMHRGHRLLEAWATLARSSLVSGGWLVAGRLADGDDIAIWLSEMPNGVVYTGTGDEDAEARREWAAAPWRAPEHAHLFSVDDTARAVSVWRELGDVTVPADRIELARRCAEAFAS